MSGANFCGRCGAFLGGSMGAGNPSPGYPLGAVCLRCGQSNPWGKARCEYCGKKMGDGNDYSGFAGGLMMAGSFFSLLPLLMYYMVMGSGGSYGFSAYFFEGLVPLLVFTIGFGAVSFVGGFFALRRKHFIFVIIAGICSILSAGLFGIIALMLVIFSKDYFES
jgi:hypothetical protein